MIINIFAGFVLPWLLGIYLLKKDAFVFLTIFPFLAMISMIVNDFSIDIGYIKVAPTLQVTMLSVLPYNIGLLPIAGTFKIYTIRKYGTPFLCIPMFCFMMTGLEWIALSFHHIQYDNGWNLGFTFFTYLFFMLLTYGYYLLLKRLKPDM